MVGSSTVCPVFSSDIMYCFEVISSSKILGSHRGVEEDCSPVECEAVLLGEYRSRCFEVLYCLHL